MGIDPVTTSTTEPRTQTERLEVVISALRRFHDLRVNGNLPQLGKFLEFDYPEHDSDLGYGLQERDFTSELVNSHNHFVLWLNRLAAWERIIRDYAEADASSLSFEFVELPLDYCLHLPYRYKQRIVFCATQLCYSCGVAGNLFGKEIVRNDEDIKQQALEEVAGRWSAGEALIDAVRSLDGPDFRRVTREYRRKAQHRFPPRIGFGDLAYLERSFPAGHRVRYTVSIMKPIQVSEVLPALAGEAEKAMAAFRAYRELVSEQWAAISAGLTDAGADRGKVF